MAVAAINKQNIWGNTGGQAQVPATGYSQFNNRTAANSQNYLSGKGLPNVWDGANQRFQGMTDNLGKQLFANGSPWGGSGGGTSGMWGYRPSPEDPTLQGYQANLSGGGRNLSDQFVRQAATAGPTRAGLNAVGGPGNASAMAHGATQALAGNYGDTYGKAYDMASRDYAAARDMWGQGASLYGQLAGNELGALRGASDYNLGQGNIGAQLNAQNLQGINADADNQWKYWKDITDYQRGDYDRTYGREQQRQQDNWNQWGRVNQQVNPANRADTLDQITSQYNRNQMFGPQINMAHLSDLQAKLQGLGGYGGLNNKSRQASYQ